MERKTKNWEYHNFVSLETVFLMQRLRLQAWLAKAHENVVLPLDFLSFQLLSFSKRRSLYLLSLSNIVLGSLETRDNIFCRTKKKLNIIEAKVENVLIAFLLLSEALIFLIIAKLIQIMKEMVFCCAFAFWPFNALFGFIGARVKISQSWWRYINFFVFLRAH